MLMRRNTELMLISTNKKLLTFKFNLIRCAIDRTVVHEIQHDGGDVNREDVISADII
jgi:hypothetical protein